MFLGLITLSGRALGNSWPYTGTAAIRKTIRTTVLFLENKRNVRALITCNLDFFFLFWESLRFHAQMKFRRPHIHAEREFAEPIADRLFSRFLLLLRFDAGPNDRDLCAWNRPSVRREHGSFN